MNRRLLIGAALGAALLAGAALLVRPPEDPAEPTDTRPSDSFDVGIPTAQEVRNMLAVYGERVESAERGVRALKKEFQRARTEIEETRRRDVSGIEKLLRELQGNAPEDQAPEPAAPRFQTFEFDGKDGRSIHVPAGSFGEATLLTGVFAPTSGEAMPVLLKLDSALIGPGRTRVPLRGAFLVGKAQGDANSRRAVVQLNTLSAVQADGTPHEAPVNGWVSDDDGTQGLRGRYVWRADEVIALSSLTGALSGGAEAMSERETTTQVTPLGGAQGAVTGDPVRFAGYRALSTAFGRMSEMMSRRLEEVVPAIYVPNARKVTVAFISGVTLEGYDLPDSPTFPYEGLDR